MQNIITSVAVCGAGTMGAGIAQVGARAGFTTILFDKSETALDNARAAIGKNLSSMVEKNRLSENDRLQALNNISFTSNIFDCKAGIIIEAIIEDIGAKRSLFSELAAVNPKETIFATNTSSLSVSDISVNIIHPERVAGMHFFNPPSLMKLVEVIRGKVTTDEVIQQVMELVKRLGKTPVLCKDFPGFIVNRVARPYYLESLKLAEEGYELETIDRIMEATGFKMGPFKLMDLIGNDINLAVTTSLYEAFNKPERFKPSPIQVEKVKNGALGRKTGKGYYQY